MWSKHVTILLVLISFHVNGQGLTVDSMILRVEALFIKYDESKNRDILISIPHNLPRYNYTDYHDKNWKIKRERATNLYIKYFDELIKSGFNINLDIESNPCVRWSVIAIGSEQEMRNVEIQRKNNEYFCEQLRMASGFEKAKNRFNCFYKFQYQKRRNKFKLVKKLMSEYEEKLPTDNSKTILKIMRKSKRKLCWGQMKRK